MFNSPFDSFQKIVAEAKEEREQLDRLLTISTPRERALLALTALALVLFAAWLFFGSALRTAALDGVLVGQGSAADASLKVAVWLKAESEPEFEQGIEIGRPVEVDIPQAGRFEGRVLAIARVPLPDWLARAESRAPISTLVLDIALTDGGGASAAADGAACQVIVDLGRQSPAAFFARSGS